MWMFCLCQPRLGRRCGLRSAKQQHNVVAAELHPCDNSEPCQICAHIRALTRRALRSGAPFTPRTHCMRHSAARPAPRIHIAGTTQRPGLRPAYTLQAPLSGLAHTPHTHCRRRHKSPACCRAMTAYVHCLCRDCTWAW
jgi:hypothetical protein